MQFFSLSLVVLQLALSVSPPTSDNPPAGANLEVSLEVKTASVPEAQTNDKAVNYHVSFDLAIKNNGTDEYNIPSPAGQLWSVVVFQRDSGKVLKWNWIRAGAAPASLAAGNALKLAAEWDPANDADSGSYVVAATFLPTGSVTVRNFTLPPPQMNADILFTGRLMGYYRMPDRQRFQVDKDATCTLKEETASPDARTFFNKFGSSPNEHQIRVGMGDNFAPNYYGRAFAEPEKGEQLKPGEYGASKGIYYWDTKASKWMPPEDLVKALKNIEDVRTGHGTIPPDNVACFLSYAHYDAIVPGMLDFHFGVERLHELARLLAGITKNTKESTDKYQPVQMLAANLMVKTLWTRNIEPVPDSAKPKLPFVTKYRQKSTTRTTETDFSLEVTNIKDNDFVFPWMQFVRIKAKGFVNGSMPPRVYLCTSDKDPDKFLENNGPKFCDVELPLRPKKPDQPETTGPGKSEKKESDKKELVYQLVRSDFKFVQYQEDKKNGKNPSAPVSLLKPGNHYAICTAGPKDIPGNPPYCVRFSVHRPFFQYPDWPEQLYPDWTKEGGIDGQWHPYTNPALYVLKNDHTSFTPVAIFGIVGPKMLENIGADNYSWQNVTAKDSQPKDTWNKQYKTQAFITEPIPTLTEMEQYFEQDYCFNHKGNRFHGIRVLLAQMRPEQARELAEHLPKSVRFDVVISAADNALATPNQIVRMEPGFQAEAEENNDNDDDKLEDTACVPAGTPKSNDGAQELLTPTSFIAVPARHDATKTRRLQARELHITSDGRTYWNYDLSGQPIPVKLPKLASKQSAPLENSFWQLIYQQMCNPDSKSGCNTGKNPDRNAGEDMTALQQLALSAIRNKVHADVALLQAKDFYPHGLTDYLDEHCKQSGHDSPDQPRNCESPPGPKLDIQQVLERIIWKGDFIKTLSITGNVLKTVLKKSEQVAETAKAGYIPIDELGNELVTLGIRPDPKHSGEYLINGKPLEPDALYTVATSDYIALGDTGYPELGKPPVGDPDPPASPVGVVYTVSAITCNAIPSKDKTSSQFSTTCDQDIPGKDFSDRAANRKPDDARPVNTNFQKFLQWTFLHQHRGQPTAHLSAATPATVQETWQKKVENGANWKWSFDQLSVGFSGLSHTGTEEQVSQKFSGALNPTVTAPHTHSWEWNANSALTLYRPRADWFVSEMLQYSSTFTAQVPGPRAEAQSTNQFVLESGSRLHLYPRNKELPQLSLALYGHFETPVGSPITTLQIANSAFPLVFDQGRTYLLLARSGLRWEDRKSYIEAGLEAGPTLNAIRQFNVLVAPGGPTVPCQLQASVSLTNCINNFNQAHPATPVANTSTVGVQRGPQDRYGAYWTMKVNVPINDTVSYNFQEFSDYFFLVSADNSADARFRHRLVHTLKFTVFPNLSFEPTYTLFLFENKLDYNFLLQQQYSVKMNYSFNFSNWHERKRQLKYKKPGT